MQRVLNTHSKALSWTIARPWALGVLALVLLVAGYFTYGMLGTNLLPEMDEGAFILDTTFPAGSSLAASQDMIDKVQAILKATPEVSITSRRTGLQLGLAAVTESNYGDITVRLKTRRSRSVQQVIADVRARVKEEVPQLDAEYTQVLEDNINDLSNSPEPIQIKLFSNDVALIHQLGPKVQAAHLGHTRHCRHAEWRR